MADYRFTAALWRHHGDAAWFFVTVPAEISEEIDERTTLTQGGFGSVRVEVTVGSTTWRTSLFPDTKAAAYVLPMKKAVRSAESLADGAKVTIELSIVTDE